MQLRKTFQIIFAMTLIFSIAALVRAEQSIPLGAETVTIAQTETSNLSLYTPSTTTAEAGNLTELTITGVSQTKAWQGFYGNVTGTIILEDAQGNRFYDWTSAEPKGEVYASVNTSISWASVECAQSIADTDGYLSGWNTFYGMNSNDYDQINNTYNLTNHPTFYTGSVTLTGCPTTYTFISDARQAEDFPAVLLSSDNNGTLIFTAVLENKTTGIRNGITGFDGEDHDFQILVGEDGHAGNDAPTTYYFWVELQ